MEEKLAMVNSLTDSLPLLRDMIKSKSCNFIEYKIEKGTCFGVGLARNDEVAVQQAFMSKGSIFSKHRHDVVEIVVLYRGRLKYTGDDGDGVIEVGGDKRFEAGSTHEIEALEDSWIIGITIPPSPGYPEASK